MLHGKGRAVAVRQCLHCLNTAANITLQLLLLNKETVLCVHLMFCTCGIQDEVLKWPVSRSCCVTGAEKMKPFDKRDE